ncbi:MAG: hypothetical protein ABIT71_15500 [Vicinamibacteraceae bacterium]
MREALGLATGRAFLDRACARHGGHDAYARTAKLALQLADLGGAVPRLKGLGRKFPSPAAVDVWPHARRVVFLDYPRPAQVGVYDHGRVAIGLDPDARLEGPSHRGTFAGIAKWRTWWPEDLIYFLGYSLVLYVSLPFSLREQELIEARRTPRGVELWFRFPAGADTHSAIQGFFFDESGRLRRHDYRAEIMGAVFNGAHVSEDYQEVDGLLLATRRTVYAKPWHYPVRTRLPIPVLTARLLPRIPGPRPGAGDGRPREGRAGDGSAGADPVAQASATGR